MLKIYDSLTRTKREFIPINSDIVNMYVCGITVYDYCHLGHARTNVAFDMIYKYLTFKGYTVNYVRNITDIDDKIIKRSNESNISTEELTKKFINLMQADFNALGLAKPKYEPKATETIDEIVEFISDLINKKYAYVGSNGDVFFSINNYSDYGKLAQQSLDSLMTGARVEQNIAKDNPLDFVLWKMAKLGEPSWPSPWGNGRPGWHIECSAMATKFLGDTIDIHGGGFDLKFPHHENERAQSEAKTGKKFVNFWMHAGFLQIDNEKMSKSLNNFLTIRDALNQYPAETLHCFLVMSHYRSEIHYSDGLLKQTQSALYRLYNTLRELDLIEFNYTEDKDYITYLNKFYAAMDDDFNVPDAFAVLFDICREINKDKATEHARKLGFMLKTLASIFGILQQNPEKYLQESESTGLSVVDIDNLIKQRLQARLDKDYQKSDMIRKELLEKGIVLEDKPNGQTIWRKVEVE